MKIDDDRPMDKPVPAVLVDGPPAEPPADRWTVRLFLPRGRSENGRRILSLGTGIVANNQWILTAGHVLAEASERPTQEQARRELARRVRVMLINTGGEIDGGRWVVDVAFGHGDMAALRIAPEHAENFRDRIAPILLVRNLGDLVGRTITIIGARADQPEDLRMATARVQIVAGDDEVRGVMVVGTTNAGDSGAGIVMHDETGEPRVVGIHTGTLRNRAQVIRRQLWIAFEQEDELFERVMGEPFRVTVAGPTPGEDNSVATCSYQVSPEA